MITEQEKITKVLQLLDLGKTTTSLSEIEEAKSEVGKMVSRESDLQMRDFLENSEGLLASYQLRQPNERTLNILERNYFQIKQSAKTLMESE